MANVIDPTVQSSSEQASLASGPRIHGEVTIDLQLPADVCYDVDDLGDGRLVIQCSNHVHTPDRGSHDRQAPRIPLPD